MARKILYKQVKELVESNNGALLSAYKNNKTPIHIRCNKCEYNYYPRLGDIRKGQQCPQCIGKVKHTIEFVKEIADNRKGKCLSDIYINNRTKMIWQCKDGHIWKSTFGSIKNLNSWCPFCDGQVVCLDDCKKLAAIRGGMCLSKEYKNAKSKLMWKCKNNHEWKTTYGVIKNNHWCPFCAKQIVSINDCQKLAKQNGGWCLSKKYTNKETRISWKCKDNHEWETTYASVRNGGWCPRCSSGKTQQKLQCILENILGHISIANYRGFDWLVYNARQEIDIWFPDIKLAVEYDGRQHFEAVSYYAGDSEKMFAEQIIRDNNKDILVKKNKIHVKHFIRFNYRETINEHYIKSRLLEEGII